MTSRTNYITRPRQNKHKAMRVVISQPKYISLSYPNTFPYHSLSKERTTFVIKTPIKQKLQNNRISINIQRILVRDFSRRIRVYLELSRASTLELLVFNYFCKKTPSQMFVWVLNTPLRFWCDLDIYPR